MAFAEKLPSGRWRGGYLAPDGKKRFIRGTRRTKREALDEANDAQSAARQGTWLDPRKGRVPFGEWVERWYSNLTLEETTISTVRYAIDLHFLPYWANREIGSITREEAQAWVSHLTERGLAPDTVRTIVGWMRTCLSAAVLNRSITANPFNRISLPQRTPPRDFCWSHRETAAIIDALATPEDRLLFQLLEWTGLRLGEASGLHLANVKPDHQVIVVRHALIYVRNARQYKIKPYPKGTQYRSVPLPEALVPHLQAHIDGLPAVSNCGLPHRDKDSCPGGLLFRHGHKGHLIHATAHLHWAQAQAVANELDCRNGGPGIPHGRPHDLRHTYATRLTASGLPIYEVSRLLGHSRISTTMRYAHHSPELLNRAANILNGLSRGINMGSSPHQPESAPVNSAKEPLAL